MISKNKIKMLRSLDTKKGRLLNKLILLEGKRLIEEVLSEKNEIRKIWFTEDFEARNLEFTKKIKKVNFEKISNKEIKMVTGTVNPQNIIAISEIKRGSLDNIKGNAIILDDISDPGNLGTIMRSASWFGIENIFLSQECVDPYNSKVIRAAMGAHFRQNIVIDKLENLINHLYSNNYKLLSTDLESNNSLKDLKINKNEKWGIIFGNEAHGLSKLTKEKIKYSVKIPQIGKIESLNVAVACGIFLYEFSK